MSDELTNQMSEQQPEQWYPARRYTFLLVCLFLLFSLFIAAQRYMPDSSHDHQPFSEELLQGDLCLKLSYASANWFGSKAGFRGEQRAAALVFYDQTARENPSSAVYRRQIIVSRGQVRKSAIMLITARGRTPSSGLREAAMWSSIYLSSDSISASRMAEYRTLIKGMSLGWVERIALADLYSRSGMKADAARELSDASASALKTTTQFGVLILMMVAVGVIGSVLLVWYVVARSSGFIRPEESELPASAAERSMLAGCLLEVFVVYIGATIVFQAVAALVITRIQSAVTSGMAVQFTVTAYVSAGFVALLYLRHRLRKSGWSLRTVGLGTRGLAVDVAWGVGGYAVCLPLVVAAGLISRFLSRYVQTPSNPIVPLFVESSTIFDRILLLLLAAVAAPIFEEIFFRGALLHSLRAKWGSRIGIVASAVAFGLVHPLPLSFLPILALGSVFGVIVNQRGSLLPSMVAHALNNTAAFMLLFVLTGS